MGIKFNKEKVDCREFDRNSKELFNMTKELEEEIKFNQPEYKVKPDLVKLRMTKREKDVLRCLIEGMNNQEIASELCVTLSTVKAHVSSIILKLNASDRIEACHFAKLQGLVE